MTVALKVCNIWKSFGRKSVLRGVSFSVQQGESLVVLGGSGSGKSVLLKIILGMLEPDKGSVLLWGKDLADMCAREKQKTLQKVGMLFQQSALFDSLPVWENIMFGQIASGKVKRTDAVKVARKYIKEIGLDPSVAFLSPADLSGGMQKRVGLARAIAGGPDLLFFDEPTTGLDPIMCRLIDDLIIKSVRSLEAAALTITHDMTSAHRVGDRVAVLHEGSILWEGAMSELDGCQVPYVRRFLDARISDNDASSD